MKRLLLGLTVLAAGSGCIQSDFTASEHADGQVVASLLSTLLQIDLTTGTTGTIFFNQSFNGETRGVDVTVLGSSNLLVDSVTLREFNILDTAVTLGARIYSSPGGTLLASADASVDTGFNQTITIPISATLVAGTTYRLAFFIPTAQHGNSADNFDPDPVFSFAGFPYTESNGVLRIGGAWDIVGDVFPTTINASVPLMIIEGSLAETTFAQLGKTPGFWSNKNGNARIDRSPKDGYVDDSVPPDTSLGGSPGRSFYVDQISESNKILKNNSCGSGSPTVFNCAAPPSGEGLSKGLKASTLNTLAAQTLALYYNIHSISGYSGQTILTLSTATNYCASLVTTPLGNLGLTPDSSVNAALTLANRLIQYSVAASLGGTTTQGQAGAMNSLLACLNRETL
jgi:hypothetical protein